ncbi:hypothetical protein [Dietzia sp.]|uniref:hypothetical protein n=1 Tax=Dietzia sp. TaxID=1871616 RepID=UPI002FDB4BF3
MIAGTIPEPALRIVEAVRRGNTDQATALSAELDPLWSLFTELGGSLRVVAAIAEVLGLVRAPSLPLPVQGLGAEGRARVAEVVESLGLGDRVAGAYR